MSDHGKFRVKHRNTGAWVKGVTMGNGYPKGCVRWTQERACSEVFDGPAVRAYFEALSDYEIVPEPPPFVFPPTPWESVGGNGMGSVAADGSSPFAPGPHWERTMREVRRRVNWHETAAEALKRAKEMCRIGHPMIAYYVFEVVAEALAKLEEEGK